MNIKTFFVWLWKSIFQGTSILMLGIYLFRDSFANIVMITFTSLILIEILNVYTQVHKLTFPMMLMQLSSAVIYFISIILLREYFDLKYIDLAFIFKVVLITIFSWLPFQMLYYVINWLDPSDNIKIMIAHNQ